MKNCKIIALLCSALTIFIMASSVHSRAEKNEQPRFILGYAMKTLYDVDIKDAHVAFSLWSKELGEETGFHVEARLYDRVEDLSRDFQKGVLDFGIVKTLDYLELKKKDIDSEIALTNVRSGKKGHKYLLLVRSDSQIYDVKDLRGKKINVVKGDEIGMLFLNTYLLKRKQSEANRFFSIIEEKVKPSQVILPVFFGQADICLVPDVSFYTMIELNPQIGQKLRVIVSSEDIIAGVGYFRKDYNQAYKQQILNTIYALNTKIRGKQILTLFKSDRFGKLEEKDLLYTQHLINEYNKLQENQR